MQESDHVLAARRHADTAQSAGGDAAVLASLAQTEALLAVTAAIERLAAVLTGPNPPAPSPAEGQAYRVEEIRRQHPNAYMPWIDDADAALLAAHRAGHDVATLADTFGRQPSAIGARLNRLGAEAAIFRARPPTRRQVLRRSRSGGQVQHAAPPEIQTVTGPEDVASASEQRRAAEPTVTVQQLLAEIRELGYPCSLNLLYRYITQGRVETDGRACRQGASPGSCSPGRTPSATASGHCSAR